MAFIVKPATFYFASSQIQDLKQDIRLLFMGIHRYTGKKLISGRKPYDLVAMTMGYRNYSELSIRSRGHSGKPFSWDYTRTIIFCRGVAEKVQLNLAEVLAIFASREILKTAEKNCYREKIKILSSLNHEMIINGDIEKLVTANDTMHALEIIANGSNHSLAKVASYDINLLKKLQPVLLSPEVKSLCLSYQSMKKSWLIPDQRTIKQASIILKQVNQIQNLVHGPNLKIWQKCISDFRF